MTMGIVSGGTAPFVGPLDSLPATTGAYSMRRLLSAYVANRAINVRRASDNATLDVAFLANGDLDVPTLTSFLTATSGFITAWYDQSGNGNDMVQVTAANQPGITLSESTMNNRPVIAYVLASFTFLSKASPPTTAQPFTASGVAKRRSSFTTSQHFFDGSPTAATIFFSATADTFGANYGSTVTASAPDNVAHCLLAVVNGASTKLAVDGTITSPGTPGTGSMQGMRTGVSNTGSTPFGGLAGELILFPSALVDADTGTLQANQKTYWGTP